MIKPKRDKRKSAKFEVEENKSGALDSKTSVEASSSDDDEANEDLSLKIVEKALSLNERNDIVSDDQHVVSVVDLSCSSSQGRSDVACTSGGGEEADLDLKSKKIVKRRKKKMKIEKVKFFF